MRGILGQIPFIRSPTGSPHTMVFTSHQTHRNKSGRSKMTQAAATTRTSKRLHCSEDRVVSEEPKGTNLHPTPTRQGKASAKRGRLLPTQTAVLWPISGPFGLPRRRASSAPPRHRSIQRRSSATTGRRASPARDHRSHLHAHRGGWGLRCSCPATFDFRAPPPLLAGAATAVRDAR
jgi:hypothetical protein